MFLGLLAYFRPYFKEFRQFNYIQVLYFLVATMCNCMAVFAPLRAAATSSIPQVSSHEITMSINQAGYIPGFNAAKVINNGEILVGTEDDKLFVWKLPEYSIIKTIKDIPTTHAIIDLGNGRVLLGGWMQAVVVDIIDGKILAQKIFDRNYTSRLSINKTNEKILICHGRCGVYDRSLRRLYEFPPDVIDVFFLIAKE